MEELNKIRETYQNIIQETRLKLQQVRRQIYHVGSIRLLLFISGVAGVIYCWQMSWTMIFVVAAVTFIPFLLLIKYHTRLFHQKEYLEKKIEINEQELEGMMHQTRCFDGGKEYIDPEHLYTYDLDVFGDYSLFQYINRTSTEMGKRELASWFNNHLRNKDEIVQRQKAIQELTPELKFRQRLRIRGLLHKGKTADEKEIIEWAMSPSHFRRKKMLRVLPAFVLITNITMFLLAMTEIITFGLAGIVFIGFITMSFAFTQQITRIQSMYGKKMQILATYAQLIRLIEEKEVQSEALIEIKELVGHNRKTASQAIRQLSSLMHSLDQRNNIMMAALLNGCMLWELRKIMRIETWREQHAEELPRWLVAIAKIDAYCSLATFAYNHPDYTYPQILKQPFSLQATALGHPLMHREKCVCNDVEIGQRPYFIIITGANMAGKSTYLRTIGANYLLACMGAPVFATHMEIYPVQLVTSLRTTDSLTDNESYFFAELKRLKMIINRLEKKEELFIVLDEILKGTNSMDKQKGSIALVKQFMQLNTNGIIATHDLLLGSLSDLYPEQIKNYRFEADITNNELTFSYKLREGIAQNMNACFLMKKMGIAIIE